MVRRSDLPKGSDVAAPGRAGRFLRFLDQRLAIPPRPEGPVVLDLFAGCGGLALGFEAAGFRTIGYEMDEDAAATYERNLQGPCRRVVLAAGVPLDDGAQVIIGGPPCQPFSVIGEQRGPRDSRDGFPAFLWAVERHSPKVAIFENVRGILYRNRRYFDAITHELRSLGYSVDARLLNAADYGVPQKRERMFVIAWRGSSAFPAPEPAPVRFTAGDALGELAAQAPPGSRFLTPSMDEYIARYEAASKCIRPRDLWLDRPARTVTCRNLAGATSDMQRVRLPDGRRRRLTVREGARLQSFPDWFEFGGREESQFKQVGNAVPPLLGRAVADCVMLHLTGRVRPRRRGEQLLFDDAIEAEEQP